MYIRGLIPQNSAELAEAVPIGALLRENLSSEFATQTDLDGYSD